MQPVYVSIRQQETGKRIHALLAENGLSVRDVQTAMGFENPQAVYKWLSGKSLPSLDNLVILSRILHTNMEDILVLDGDVSLFDRKFLRNFPIKQNAPRRMRTRAIGIMSQKRPRSARESRKRDSFIYLHGGYFAQNNERHEA